MSMAFLRQAGTRCHYTVTYSLNGFRIGMERQPYKRYLG